MELPMAAYSITGNNRFGVDRGRAFERALAAIPCGVVGWERTSDILLHGRPARARN